MFHMSRSLNVAYGLHLSLIFRSKYNIENGLTWWVDDIRGWLWVLPLHSDVMITSDGNVQLKFTNFYMASKYISFIRINTVINDPKELGFRVRNGYLLFLLYSKSKAIFWITTSIFNPLGNTILHLFLFVLRFHAVVSLYQFIYT